MLYTNRGIGENVMKDQTVMLTVNPDNLKDDQIPQIHHLMGEKDLVGARGKAGYDGYGTNTTITNEVQSLCNRESCHSSMGRSIALGA